MDAEAHLQISRHVEAGEHVLWAGRPTQGLRLRGSDVYMIPFSIVGGAAFVSLAKSAISSEVSFLIAMLGVLLAIYGTVGRLFVVSRLRAKTFYGLTNQRVVILSGLPSASVHSMPLRKLLNVSVRERSDRTGTIDFGGPFVAWGMGLRDDHPPRFLGIPDVKRVHDQVIEARRAAL